MTLMISHAGGYAVLFLLSVAVPAVAAAVAYVSGREFMIGWLASASVWAALVAAFFALWSPFGASAAARDACLFSSVGLGAAFVGGAAAVAARRLFGGRSDFGETDPGVDGRDRP